MPSKYCSLCWAHSICTSLCTIIWRQAQQCTFFLFVFLTFFRMKIHWFSCTCLNTNTYFGTFTNWMNIDWLTKAQSIFLQFLYHRDTIFSNIVVNIVWSAKCFWFQLPFAPFRVVQIVGQILQIYFKEHYRYNNILCRGISLYCSDFFSSYFTHYSL